MPPCEELRTRLGVIYFSMTINGKVHCFFEQSGVFKNEFRKLGYEAYDYDIQNNFGETDYVFDLFAEIEKAYSRGAGVFDSISADDLIMAFFPCIYFSALSQMAFSFGCVNYRKLSVKEKTDKVLERSANREHFFGLLVKLISVCLQRELRMVVENPWAEQTFLKANFIMPPTIIDNNRMLRGDYFVKPTAYWYINCEPTHGFTYQRDKKQKIINKCKSGIKAGICSEERSMISPDYARNFICDFIIGKCQTITQPSLFDNDNDLLLPNKI